METLTFAAFAQALAMLGDVALIIICPVVLWQMLKLIKLEINFEAHKELNDAYNDRVDARLKDHGDQIDKLLAGGK
jgi:hypothetical protein